MEGHQAPLGAAATVFRCESSIRLFFSCTILPCNDAVRFDGIGIDLCVTYGMCVFVTVSAEDDEVKGCSFCPEGAHERQSRSVDDGIWTNGATRKVRAYVDWVWV